MELQRMDLLLIREVYVANDEFRNDDGVSIPYLPRPAQFKRAAKLASAGLLKAHDLKIMPSQEGMDGYTVTEAGIDAYNAALTPNAFLTGATTDNKRSRDA